MTGEHTPWSWGWNAGKGLRELWGYLLETRRWKHRQGAPVRPHHVNIRLEEHKLCLLVMIGVRADGRKELIALADGYRDSAESWAVLLRDCARRGMRAPVMAVGDGALGMAFKPPETARDPGRMVNAPPLAALVRAGGPFINGKPAERPGEEAQPEAA